MVPHGFLRDHDEVSCQQPTKLERAERLHLLGEGCRRQQSVSRVENEVVELHLTDAETDMLQISNDFGGPIQSITLAFVPSIRQVIIQLEEPMASLLNVITT